MFGIGTTELLIILFVALIIMGPKRLPDVAKTIGRALKELTRAKEEFRDTIYKETHLDEVEEVKKAFTFSEDGSESVLKSPNPRPDPGNKGKSPGKRRKSPNRKRKPTKQNKNTS